MKRLILTILLVGPVLSVFVNAEKTMFKDCLRPLQVSIALADRELQEDLDHCENDADWLLRGWCRREANLAHDAGLGSALQTYDDCEFGI